MDGVRIGVAIFCLLTCEMPVRAQGGNDLVFAADSNAPGIFVAAADTFHFTLIPGLTNPNVIYPVAIEYDPVDGMVYWTDLARDTISRAFMNGTGIEILVTGLSTPDGLGLDVENRMMYWTDVDTKLLGAATMDGQNISVLFNLADGATGTVNPRGIVAHSAKRYLFWTDWGTIARIERANCDGSGRITLVDTNLIWPNGLALDTEACRLYWCDAATDRIEYSDFDGQGRTLVVDLASVGVHPFDVEIYKGDIYLADWSMRSGILRVDIAAATVSYFGSTSFGRPQGLHIWKGPDLTCPCGVTVSTDHGRADAVVTWDIFNSSSRICENDAGNTVVSGGAYPLGMTVITCTASDASFIDGDCNFIITVVDTEAPNVTCPNNETTSTDSGVANAVVTWSPMVSATDNVDLLDSSNVTCEDDTGNIVMSGDTYTLGTTTVTCTASDTAFNEDMCQFYIIVIDNEAPNVTCPSSVTVSTDSGMADAVVTWSPMLSATDNVDTVDFNNVTCEDSAGTAMLSVGAYSLGMTVITCTTTDTSLNEGNCRFTITVVDTEAPNVSCPSSVNSSTESGMAHAIVTWSQMSSATDNVDGILNSSSIACEDSAGDTVVSGGAYGSGTTRVTCIATDASLNEGNCSFTITVTDNEAPNVSCPNSMNVSTDIGMADAVVTWFPMLSAIDNVDVDSSSIACEDGAGNTVVSGGTYEVGMTDITCSATDSASNEGICQFTISVADTEAPNFTCPSSVNTRTDRGVAYTIITWSPMVSATDNVDVVDFGNITCKDGAGNDVVSGSQYGLGTTTVTCRATDSAFNEGICQFVIIVADEEAPNVTCPNSVTVDTDSGMAVSSVTWSSAVSATDNVDVNSNNVTCDDGSGNNVVSGGAYSLGTTVVTCTATDDSLNEGNCSFSITVMDTEAPNVTCPSSVTVSTESGMADASVAWSPMVSGTDNVDVVDSSSIACADGAGNAVVSGGAYSLGMTTVTCTATDASLNEGNCSFTITVVDKEAPNVTCPNSATVNTDSGMAVASVTWSSAVSATDNVDVLDSSGIACDDGSGNVVSGGAYSLGTTIVTCTATDASRNEGNCSFTITVVDTEAPNVTCPSSVAVSTESGMADASVAWSPMVSATDNVDVDSSSIACEDGAGNAVVSGGAYSLGKTTVTCTASDASLNEGNCSFTITVVDTEAPNVTCPNSVTVNTNIGMAVASVTWSPVVSATDNVDVVDSSGIACDDGSGRNLVSGGAYSLGMTIVTCSATDGSLNKGNCSFTITVEDKEAPNVTCPRSVTVNTESGRAYAFVTLSSMLSVTDNVDVLEFSNITCKDGAGDDVASGGTYEVGMTNIICTATDSASNEETCQFIIIVKDDEAPRVTCPSNADVTVTRGTVSARVEWAEAPTVSDNVDGANATINCADEGDTTVVSGGTYVVGVTTIICTAQDSSGNAGNCTFTIMVQVCPLSGDSCSSGGYLSAEYCQCVCPDGISGVTCNVDDPCVASPDLCTGNPGQYCQSDPSVESPAGYKCMCRELDGYFYNATTDSCTRNGFKSVTVIVVVEGVNGVAAVFRPEFRNPNSAASKTFLQLVASVIKHVLLQNPATSDTQLVNGVLVEQGSVVFMGVARAPLESSVTANAIMQVLVTEATAGPLTDGQTTLNVDRSVTTFDSTTACPSNYCQNGGTCNVSGQYPHFVYACRYRVEPFSTTPTTSITQAGEGGLDPLVIILVTVAVVCLLIVLLALGFCLYAGRRPYAMSIPSQAAYDTRIYSLHDYDDQSLVHFMNKRRGRKAQITAETSPYMHKSILRQGFTSPYVADGMEAHRSYPVTSRAYSNSIVNETTF